VHWRKRDAIEVKLPPVFKKRGIAFTGVGLKHVSPGENQLELNDGTVVDYLVIAPGPDLAFDEIAGLGPHGGFTQSVCHVDHAEAAGAAFDRFVENPGPIVVGAVQAPRASARPTSSP
jgi:sulfide:quinone oxidoreductase